MAVKQGCLLGLWVVLLLCLISPSTEFAMEENEWEGLGAEVSLLHRLKGMANRFTQLSTRVQHNAAGLRLKNVAGSEGDFESMKLYHKLQKWNTMDTNNLDIVIITRIIHSAEDCEDLALCILQHQEELNVFLKITEGKKTRDVLLSASEVAYTYKNKLILIMDKEAETLQQADQEYSKDPQYSTKAEITCLESNSYPSAIDSYTVIKIFGSVSEDGNTVSGFSGSSLASLMINTALQRASIFSINSNTSSTFRNDFLQVFKAHNIHLVLESTSQGDHIYQTLDSSDTVVEYRVPERPVDHTTEYDWQHILIMEDDQVVREAAKFLFEKHQTVSSVYMLENQRPKLIKGDPMPLTAESRLTLVGHGRKDKDGTMILGGYTAEDVAKIISHMNIKDGQIKTTSVVGCDVGSDEAFISTLLKELYSRSILTELHLKNSLVQVAISGQKYTAEITPDGKVWRHKDDSTKVVAKLDTRNFETVFHTKSDNRGEEIYSDATDVLGHGFEDTWPNQPGKFAEIQETYTNEIEALAWAFFNTQKNKQKKGQTLLQNLKKHETSQNDIYVMYKIVADQNKGMNLKELNYQKENTDIDDILNKCYEIRSGEDVLNIITHYASVGEKDPMYFMLHDWIYKVEPENLYVYLTGKKLKSYEKVDEIKNSIKKQENKESYDKMRRNIKLEHMTKYSEYAFQTLQGNYERYIGTTTEAWFGTYFMASVISESARNFRSFPVTLMALDMSRNEENPEILKKGQKIIYDELPMTCGGTWLNTNKRGFHGSAKSNLDKKKSLDILKKMIQKENSIYKDWIDCKGKETGLDNNILEEFFKIVLDTENVEDQIKAYNHFKEKLKSPSTSGALGGAHDGPVTADDVHAAAEVEHSLKLSSYYSRSSAMLAQHMDNELKRTFGEKLQELQAKPDSVTVKDGELHCLLVSSKNPQDVTEWNVKLPEESQHLMENIEKNINMIFETHETHMTSKHLERAGMALGTLGLMMGAQAAVHAFEKGDIGNGTIATLQIVHGVTGMTLAALGKRVSVAAEGKVMKAISTFLKNPVTKRALFVLPVMGMAFGVYNIEEDIRRGDALGYIDAGIDSFFLLMDVVDVAQPELTPLIAPINLALNAIRMLIDDIYLDIQAEFNKLPPNAGIVDKIGAFFRGLGEGSLHFIFDVASFFYTIPYHEIENGQKLVEQISDYHKYYSYMYEEGRKAIDFTAGESSWNGGNITFCLSEEGPSELCMDYFVSADESFEKKCWPVDTAHTDDIVLGIGESHKLEYSEIKLKVLLFIPAGSVWVVSGYQTLEHSRYGQYSGNDRLNNFFAVQKNTDSHTMEIMLSYYYRLYGKAGDDTFYLGPQRSYVEGQGGRDTYIIPKDGGNTNINNYDPLKTQDLLILSVNYEDISVSKSANDVVLQYLGNHYVRILNWFTGELYRHLNIMSDDGVMFEISTAVISQVKLTARAVNLMYKSKDQTVNTTNPLLQTVTNVLGSCHNDRLIGNAQSNMLDGGGGWDYIMGGEGEDIYVVNGKRNSKMKIDNYSRDKELDLVMIEANLHSFKTTVRGNDLILMPFTDQTSEVILINWFLSEESRHLLVITKDLVTFGLSAEKSLCMQPDPFYSRCILSQSIDYSKSSSPLEVDLEDDEAFENVTEVRGSNLNDKISGNSQANILIPGEGYDFLEGRSGQDLYVVTAGQGTKTISNYAPDLAPDTLVLNEMYNQIEPRCYGQDIKLFIKNTETVQLKGWFSSSLSQHLQIRSVDGITFLLPSSSSQCEGLIKLPQSMDHRNEKIGQIMNMNTTEFLSVVEMYGSSGYDTMIGNEKDNWLDPFTGGGCMTGGEGKDTYIVKPEYGNQVEISNFALDEMEDTVQVQADFLSSPFTVHSENDDVIISFNNLGMKTRLKDYRKGRKFQHLSFQSADGVYFRVVSPVTNQSEVPQEPWIEAYKMTVKCGQSDYHIDLSSQRNLSTIHTVQGCSYQSNHIQAGDLDSAVFGGLKDDVLDGGDGHDTLIGGQGNDVLMGSSGNDMLYGDEGDDTLLGGPGFDNFVPGPGADVMDGGSGRDTVLYWGNHETGTGVYINLLSGEGHMADAEGDVLKDVENVIGTIYSDVLVSGHEPALLKGSDGDDVLVSVTDGDTLIGGDGRDIYMMVPHYGWTTIDNCAEDNATDILYLPSVELKSAECMHDSLGLQITFHNSDDTFVGIYLKNWVNNTNECGHLTLIISDNITSVEAIQQNCKLGLGLTLTLTIIKKVVGTTIITGLSIIAQVIGAALFKKRRQRKKSLDKLSKEHGIGEENVEKVEGKISEMIKK